MFLRRLGMSMFTIMEYLSGDQEEQKEYRKNGAHDVPMSSLEHMQIYPDHSRCC
jgi:hypothetical protein